MATLPSEEDVWYIVRCYFEKYGFVRHSIESFNHFIDFLLPHIIQEAHEIRVFQAPDEEHVVTLCNVSVSPPTYTDKDEKERDLLPHVARIRNLTYSSAICVDVVHDILTNGVQKERRLYREVVLCHIPIMIGSNACHSMQRELHHECELDPGGYFIVSGAEKVLVSQEKLHNNVPYVFPIRQPSKYCYQCEIRACNEKKLRSTSSMYLFMTNIARGTAPQIMVEIPFLSCHISLMGMFRLLGVETKEEAIDAIVGSGDGLEETLIRSILHNDATADMSIEELYEHIGKEGTKEPNIEKQRKYIDHLINCETLPHQGLKGTNEVRKCKVLFLGIMVKKLVRVYNGQESCDDRDHMSTKRIDCAGVQFGLLFRQIFRTTYKSMSAILYKTAEAGKMNFTNLEEIIMSKKITQAFRWALATGNWGINTMRNNVTQSGVAQQLARMTTTSTLSLLRKISTPIAKDTKNPKPRQLHPTTWGIVCPMDTPEGGACGLSKSLAMMAHVRIGTFCEETISIIESLSKGELEGTLVDTLSASSTVRNEGIPLFINGILLMYVHPAFNKGLVCSTLRKLRMQGSIPFDTTITATVQDVVVDTDAGCLLRPLLRVEKLPLLSDYVKNHNDHHRLFEDLISEGFIEYLDKQEENEVRVAISPFSEPEEGWSPFSHCEIHPSLISGLCGSLIPFPDFNQSPRNTYQSAMMKQAVGVPATNHSVRMDSISHILCSPQKPLVTTRMDEIIGASRAPSGINAIVAIMCYTGQNQEDSLILNRGALERGLFRSVKYHCYRDEEKQNGGSDAERFKNINKSNDNITGKKNCDYLHLDDNGIVKVGTRVNENNVIICKTIVTTDLGEGARSTTERDKSTLLKNEDGIVDSSLMLNNRDGTRIAKVKIRKTRTPIVGDKLSSRMGQKGVIGAILDEEDMPFTEEGIRPDIIMNPHAIPSRMTIGHLTECLLSILCCKRGERGDATMFRDTSLEHICDELEKEGYDRHGRVKLYNGFTGEEFPSLVFVGPTYYQRLKHMAADKDHARSRGPVHILSRQPTEGRSRHGGLRTGEMERDAIIAHGASEFLKDRLLDNSDPSTLTVCGKCGLLACPSANGTKIRNKNPFCKVCDSGDHVQTMNSPFTFKLLLQELQAMNIGVKFEF
jgi:DNA-directed RNA polymerase II subunit RPB2